MKKKIMAALLCGTMAASIFAGCGSESDNSSRNNSAVSGSSSGNAGTDSSSGSSDNTGSSASQDGSGLKIAVFIAQNSNEITMGIGEGAKEYGESVGAEITVFDAQYDQDTQISQMETCIVQGYNALIVEPVSSNGIVSVAKTAKDSGIPVITVMQDSEDTTYIDAHVGADHTEASVMEMEAICEALGGKGKIAILDGTMGTTGQIQITEGLTQALENYPDIEIVEEQTANFLIDEAVDVTETWLQKRDDIDAIVAQSDAMALGAMKACQDAGMTDILIGGRDCTSDMRAALENGTAYCTVYQSSPEMGKVAVQEAITLINGGTVEDVYYTTNILVTGENVAEYPDFN